VPALLIWFHLHSQFRPKASTRRRGCSGASRGERHQGGHSWRQGGESEREIKGRENSINDPPGALASSARTWPRRTMLVSMNIGAAIVMRSL
jgi:hypothetical protein